MMRCRFGSILACMGASLSLLPLAAAQVSVEIGIHDLNKRMGPLSPTGAGIVIGQVEIPDSGNWGPNQADSEFVGKTFVIGPNPPGAPGNSGHATLVGQNWYGTSSGMAPGVTTIYLYEALSWLFNAHLLQGQAGTPPLLPPGGLKIFNNSWIGSLGGAADVDALRRADFAVNRDQLIVVSGVNNVNNGPQQALMCFQFNGISVGLASGGHVSGPTPVGYDGPGRSKPEIVAPSQFTSFATPYVSAVAARMVQAARTAPLSSNPNAERADVIKAAMLGGANHRASWSNCTGGCASGPNRGSTSAPLDPIYGVDVVNANSSHLILTGNQQPGSASLPSGITMIRRGWDLASFSPNTSKFYRFHLSALADKVSILATWNAVIPANFGGATYANFNLTLRRYNANGSLMNLTGNAGLPVFSAGNVISNSNADNVEHLYIQNLQPGDYLLEVERLDSLAGNREIALAWLLPKKNGDANEDGYTNVADLLGVINGWGSCSSPCPPNCAADMNGDCLVNVADMLVVINNWG